MGCWTPVERFAIDAEAEWQARLIHADGSEFSVHYQGQELGVVQWSLVGRHNVMNALAALAACAALGVELRTLLPSLKQFVSVKRRLEYLGHAADVAIYDDFAHHPTAIRTTLHGLRAKVGTARIIVAMEPRSNSMRLGAHSAEIAPALESADAVVFLHRPELPWHADAVLSALKGQAYKVASVAALIETIASIAQAGDHVVFMSNGGFEDAPRRCLDALKMASV
jgi:UDP-N-acetylmuramate: L-alanyl-gamma-D-glutamyl-meso-diaminopimelate ligase